MDKTLCATERLRKIIKDGKKMCEKNGKKKNH